MQARMSPAGSSEEMTLPLPCQHGLSVEVGLNRLDCAMNGCLCPMRLRNASLMQLTQVLACAAECVHTG